MKQQNQFGAAFRAVRLARGLTQEDFAHESGRTYISELERGLKQPTLQKIDELAVPLTVHPLTLLILAYLKKFDDQSCEELLCLVRSELREVLSR
ncbi:helix-turn-helix domain-containing protein [Duganella vulcania]|uniref:Helix-turn-helix domain-containing protein n=1 Tax=Duganella vulcania TaxID=2692166 RepID=A0A845GHF9_9BURK|nr:helix-turn-helix transcriptional regulator [Duganella vulcania]MYM92458.1 helix-turn-helix domain-containing protein [Duganella vulcania]